MSESVLSQSGGGAWLVFGGGSCQGRILQSFPTFFCWALASRRGGFIRDVATREWQGGLVFFFPSEVVLKCLRVIFTQFCGHLLNTCCVLCLVWGAGDLQQSTQGKPCLHGAYVLEKKASKQMSKYMIGGVVVKLMKGSGECCIESTVFLWPVVGL